MTKKAKKNNALYPSRRPPFASSGGPPQGERLKSLENTPPFANSGASSGRPSEGWRVQEIENFNMYILYSFKYGGDTHTTRRTD
jgi:hypothetical protein